MKKKSTEQLIFPILVGVLSLFNILQNFNSFYLTSVLVSVVGLLATTLFFLDIKKASVLFYIWIIAQLITYTSTSFSYYTNQFPFISLGITFERVNSIFAINFAPLFFFIGYRLLKMYDLIGKKVSIKPIKVDSYLVPIEGEITEIIDRSKDGKWFKVEYLEGEDLEPKSVIIKPKGEERFSRKASIFAFVKESDGNNNFIDWGKVKLY